MSVPNQPLKNPLTPDAFLNAYNKSQKGNRRSVFVDQLHKLGVIVADPACYGAYNQGNFGTVTMTSDGIIGYGTVTLPLKPFASEHVFLRASGGNITISGGALDGQVIINGQTAFVIYDCTNGWNIVAIMDNADIADSVTTGITAFAGGGQGSATQLTTEYNRVDTVATAADSVKLPISQKGLVYIVKNNTTTDLAVFPATGGQINAAAANASITIPGGDTKIFQGVSATRWETNQTVSSGAAGTVSNPTFTFNTVSNQGMYSVSSTQLGFAVSGGLKGGFNTSGLFTSTITEQTSLTGVTFVGHVIDYAFGAMTALAGGAQAGTALIYSYNNFTTVATAADSAQLPIAILGKKLVVKNAAAKAMAIFGQTGDSIDGAAANAAFTLQPGQEVKFEATTGSAWFTDQGTSLGTVSSVTQATSITTGVTVNSKKGIITTFTPSTAALAATTFTVTNNKATATSNIRAWVTEYGGTVITNGLPYVFVKNQTATTFDIIIYNAHATNALATSMKIGFEIIN